MRISIAAMLIVCAASAMAQTPACMPPPANLTAWWPFETAGASSPDVAMFNNAAAVSGGATTGTGAVKKSLCFANVSQFASVADHAEIDFAGACPQSEAMTIDFWIRTTQGGGVITILDKRVRATNFLRGYAVFLFNGRPGLQLATGTGSSACGAAGSACSNYGAPPSSPSVADGKWHLVAIRIAPRCGAAAQGTMFVDGKSVFTFKPREGELANDAALTIGRVSAGFSGTSLQGCIDELELVKRGLTDAEVAALFAAGSSGKCPPCIHPPSVCPPGKPKIGEFKSPGGGWGTGTFAVCLEGPQIVTKAWCSAKFTPQADPGCDGYKGWSTMTPFNGKMYCVFERTNSTYYKAFELEP